MKVTRIITALALAMIFTTICTLPVNAIGFFAQWQDSKDEDSGYGFGLKQSFSIIPIISVEARASWLRYSSDDGAEDLDMFPLEAFGRASLGMFYVGLGAGYYIFSGESAPKNSFGGFAAAGIEITLLGLGAFGELRYLYLEPELDSNIGGTSDMNGFGANVGVILPF